MKISRNYYKKVNSKLVKKDYAETILQFDREIETNPKIARAYLDRGIIKNFSLDHESSLFDFSKTPIIDPFKTEVCPKINFSQNSGYQHSALAIADFDKAIEINPVFAKAYFIRGIVRSCLHTNSKNANPDNYKLERLDNYTQDNLGGFADFDKAIEIDPQFAEAYYTRGLAKSYHHNKSGKAVDFIKLKQAKSTLTETLSMKGYLVNNQVIDYDGAIADFDKAIRINPEFADAYYCRGLAKNLLQNTTAKTRQQTNRMNVPGSNAKKSLRGGSAMDYQLKKYEGIIADYDTAIKINPKHSNAYYSRGLVKMVFQDRWEKMKYEIINNEIVSENPQYSVYVNSGKDGMFENYALAITDFDKAIQINPLFANAYYHRGVARFCCNDLSGAMTDMKKAIEIDPVNKEGYRRIAAFIGIPGLSKKGSLN